jgi:hypothetical protein
MVTNSGVWITLTFLVWVAVALIVAARMENRARRGK